MAENGITLMSYGRGTPFPADPAPLLDEARLAALKETDPGVRSRMLARIESLRYGNSDLLLFSLGGQPVGLISCEARDDDVQLPFGYVLRAHDEKKAAMFEMAVRHLEKRYRIVRSNFKWPEPEAFSAAARAMGFQVVERMDMTRDIDSNRPVRPLPEGLEIVPYSSPYFEEVARMMCDTTDLSDRVVLPLFSSVDGCRTMLGQILGGAYGAYQPGLSFVILAGGQLAGYMLTASYGEGVVHIDDIAVAPGFRGKGLASAMIDRLLRDGGIAGNRSVLLTVTTTNQDALRLYRHKGFTVKETFRQHVYIPNGK